MFCSIAKITNTGQSIFFYSLLKLYFILFFSMSQDLYIYQSAVTGQVKGVSRGDEGLARPILCFCYPLWKNILMHVLQLQCPNLSYF